jgi:hypothetical protein
MYFPGQMKTPIPRTTETDHLSCRHRAVPHALLLCCFSVLSFAEDTIDTTDPTRIYSYLGGGPKYSNYTNGEHMWEMRITGNWGIDENDMLLGEFGYGRHSGESESGDQYDWTNSRIRWFHLFNMDYELPQGYRGMGLQVDAQLAGSLKGTDGQNVLTVGAMPVWALTPEWNLYWTISAVGAWDKEFSNYNGSGGGTEIQLIFNPDWWHGAQLRITPSYRYFVTGELEDEGSGSLDINLGGQVNDLTAWDITAQKNFDTDLRSFRRGRDTGLENDFNIFFNLTVYF